MAPLGMRRIFSINLGICTSLRWASLSAYNMPAGASRTPVSPTYLQHIAPHLDQKICSGCTSHSTPQLLRDYPIF